MTGTAARFYVDGSLWGEPLLVTGSILPSTVDGFLTIGAEDGRGFADRRFHGSIDEVLLYGRALGNNEIAELAAQAPTVCDPDSEGLLCLDFEEDGVLPSSLPEIQVFSSGTTTLETDAFAVADGLLEQRQFGEQGRLLDQYRAGPVIRPHENLSIRTRLRIRDIDAPTGVNFVVFDERHLYSLAAMPGGLCAFGAGTDGTCPGTSFIPIDLSDFVEIRLDSSASSNEYELYVDSEHRFTGTATNRGEVSDIAGFGNGLGAGQHHRYELAYDPGTGDAQLAVNGVVVLTGYTGFTRSLTRVNFGAFHGAGVGQGNYSCVEWKVH